MNYELRGVSDWRYWQWKLGSYRDWETVIQKEVMGYKIINSLLDGFCTAYNKKVNGTASNYDDLLLKLLPERFQFQKESLYDRLLHICHFVSLLTDGKALELYKTIQANK